MLPDNIRERVEELKMMLTRLAAIRGPAFYGYEEQGIPASQAFTTDYAQETLMKVKPLVELCVEFATTLGMQEG